MRTLFLVGLLAVSPACASTQPPAGTYTPAVQRQFNADELTKNLTALAQTAVNMNRTTGKTHLSDKDTDIARTFTLSGGAFLQAWGQGATTVAAAKVVIDGLSLPPGIATAVRASVDRVLADKGVGASALLLIRDAYTTFMATFSIDAQRHPALVAALGAITSAINTIPVQ